MSDELNETNVSQRAEIIMKHFRLFVRFKLGGQTKAMVLTHYKEDVLTYYKVFKAYVEKKIYSDLDALIKFSGRVKFDGEEDTYTEV